MATIQPPLDYSDDGPGMEASGAILAFLATACVILRIWSRRLGRLPLGVDDYLVILALLVHHAFFASSLVSVISGGLGRDIRIVATENPDALVILFKSLFASEITYGLSSTLVKLSVLAFYWRCFPTPAVKLGCKIIGTTCVLWLVAIEITNVLQCRPLQAFWHLEMQVLPTTKCVDTILFFLGNSIANCCIDFFTLTLPIREIAKLHTARKTKIGIAAVFLLGSIAFAASLTRTISTGQLYREGNVNFTKQFVVSGMATVVEVYVAIIGACLPAMVPAYRQLRYGEPLKSTNKSNSSKGYYFASNKSNAIDQGTHGSHGRPGRQDPTGSFERLGHSNEFDNSNHSQRQLTDISTWDDHRSRGVYASDIPMDGIMVKKDLTLSNDPTLTYNMRELQS